MAQQPENGAGSPQRWLRHASSDLQLSRLARGRPEILQEQACFHAQQAAEKALKAVLLWQGMAIPRIHDIHVLLQMVERLGIQPPQAVRDARILNPYAVETRYPDYAPGVTQAEVDEAIRLAEAVVVWATGVTGSSGPAEEGP